MQGLWINGQRPRSKKAVREAIDSLDTPIVIEATSTFANEYGGPLTHLPNGSRIEFVGPDPHTDRRFYGTLTKDSFGSVKVS